MRLRRSRFVDAHKRLSFLLSPNRRRIVTMFVTRFPSPATIDVATARVDVDVIVASAAITAP
jgi:hypothetical protein